MWCYSQCSNIYTRRVHINLLGGWECKEVHGLPLFQGDDFLDLFKRFILGQFLNLLCCYLINISNINIRNVRNKYFNQISTSIHLIFIAKMIICAIYWYFQYCWKYNKFWRGRGGYFRCSIFNVKKLLFGHHKKKQPSALVHQGFRSSYSQTNENQSSALSNLHIFYTKCKFITGIVIISMNMAI